MHQQDVFVSVVAPLRDASDYVEAFVRKISDVMSSQFKEYEIILIDACSEDDTVAIVECLQTSIKNIQLYCLSRPSNWDIALVAGIDNGIGDFIITIDPRYDPPELIPNMIDLGTKGFDIVYGVREDHSRKKDRRLYDWSAKTFYKLFSRLTGLYIPPEVSSYRMLSRRVVNYVAQNIDRHHLLKVLPAFAGYRQAKLPYKRTNLVGSKDRVSYANTILNAIGMILSVSITPLRLVTGLALAASILNLLYALYVVAVALFKEKVAEGWISLSLQSAGMFFLLCLMLAIVSEYLFKILERTSERPLYHIGKESLSTVIERKKELNIVSTSASMFSERGYTTPTIDIEGREKIPTAGDPEMDQKISSGSAQRPQL